MLWPLTEWGKGFCHTFCCTQIQINNLGDKQTHILHRQSTKRGPVQGQEVHVSLEPQKTWAKPKPGGRVQPTF